MCGERRRPLGFPGNRVAAGGPGTLLSGEDLAYQAAWVGARGVILHLPELVPQMSWFSRLNARSSESLDSAEAKRKEIKIESNWADQVIDVVEDVDTAPSAARCAGRDMSRGPCEARRVNVRFIVAVRLAAIDIVGGRSLSSSTRCPRLCKNQGAGSWRRVVGAAERAGHRRRDQGPWTAVQEEGGGGSQAQAQAQAADGGGGGRRGRRDRRGAQPVGAGGRRGGGGVRQEGQQEGQVVVE